jgi:simple sugar transport system substrate-binding protein
MKRKVLIWSLMVFWAALLLIPTRAQDEFIFGVVLVGPRNDGGWSQSHFEAAEYVEAKLPGARKIVFESLNPADSPGVTLLDVVADMVDDGAKVIFTTSDSFEEDTNVVAEAFPDVVFINITGSNVLEGAPPNVGNFNGMMEAPRILAGCAAALTTETGSIGYLGALINPETRRLAASSYLGARYCYETYRSLDPDALKFEIVWIGFWFNIPGVTLDPTEVATEFFNGGADVVISGIDTTESIAVAGQFAAQGQRTFAIPYGNAAGCSEAPNACIGVAYYNWGPAYLDTVLEVQAGTWEQKWEWLEPVWDEISEEGFYTGVDTSIIGYLNGAGFPEENLEALTDFAQKMAEFMNATEDQIYLWQGPLKLQDGTELAAEGEPVELLDIWFLPQLLEGMLGASQ